MPGVDAGPDIGPDMGADARYPYLTDDVGYVPVNGYAVEIWKSGVGFASGYSLLTIIYSNTIASFSYLDEPIALNNTFWYRARRQDLDTLAYSDWSNVVQLQSTGDRMSFVPVSSATRVGIGIQPPDSGSVINNFSGQGCTVTELLDYLGGAIEVDRPAIHPMALADTPTDKTGAPITGDFMANGSFDLEVAPSGGFFRTLIALFGIPVTTGNAAPYTHVFKNDWSYRLCSIAHQIKKDRSGSGDHIIYHCPDSMIHAISIGVGRPTREVVRARIGVKSGNKFVIASETLVGLDVVGASTAPRISPSQCSFKIGGAIDVSVRSASLDYSMQTEDVEGLSGYQGATDFGRIVSQLSLSLTAYFTDQQYEALFYGYSTVQDKPFGFVIDAQETNVDLILPVKVGTSTYSIKFTMPKCAVVRMGKPVNGRGLIMQDITVQPRLDLASGTDFIVTVINGVNAAGAQAVGTAITGLPANSVHS